MRSKNKKYIPAIDHLRAVAAIYIILFHGTQRFFGWSQGVSGFSFKWWFETTNPFYAFIYEGHTAVALFIVLSGFVLTFGSTSVGISFGQFYFNRFLRIFPMFLFVVLIGLLAYPERWDANAFFIRMFLGKIQGVLDLEHWTDVTWSVVVEDHCYLLFPLVLFILRTNKITYILAFIIMVSVLRTALSLYYGPTYFVNYGSVLGRVDQFAMGALAAKIFQNYQIAIWRWALPLSITAIFTAIYAFHLVGGFPNMGMWRTIWPLLEGALWAFFVLSYVALFKDSNGAISTVLAKIGAVSYSIYLLHIPVIHYLGTYGVMINFTGNNIRDAFLSALILAIPVTIAVSFVTYRFVESPFLKMRKKYIRSKLMTE